MSRVFAFGDRSVDVPTSPFAAIVEEADWREYDTLEQLTEAILAHDEALARDRDWRDAEPRP